MPFLMAMVLTTGAVATTAAAEVEVELAVRLVVLEIAEVADIGAQVHVVPQGRR
jgi:hypothetical protein